MPENDILIHSEIGKINIISPKLRVNPEQDRIIFDKNKLEEMAESIKNNGLTYPITVAKHPLKDLYTIVDGERRWRASIINRINEIDKGLITEKDEYPIDARIYYPETEDEYAKLLFIGMDNGNEQRESVSPLEKGVSYREKIRDKRVSGKINRLFKDLREMTSAQLGFNKVKKDLDENQNKLFDSKYKSNSKCIRNASTTHHIEDEICTKNGIDDKYLMLRLTQLSREYSLPTFGGAEQRQKDKAKLDEDIKNYGNLTEEEIAVLSPEDIVKYEKTQSIIKKSQIVNRIYDELNQMIINGEYDLDDVDSYNEFKSVIDEKIDAAVLLAQASKEKSALSGKKEYKTLGSKYVSTKKGCKIELDYTKINDESVKILVNQILSVLENKSKQS